MIEKRKTQCEKHPSFSWTLSLQAGVQRHLSNDHRCFEVDTFGQVVQEYTFTSTVH